MGLEQNTCIVEHDLNRKNLTICSGGMCGSKSRSSILLEKE